MPVFYLMEIKDCEDCPECREIWHGEDIAMWCEHGIDDKMHWKDIEARAKEIPEGEGIPMWCPLREENKLRDLISSLTEYVKGGKFNESE